MTGPAEITQGVKSNSTMLVDAEILPVDAISKVLDDDNLLIEIIVRLGFPTTLVRTALVCKRWLRHASDPAFLCRFRKLHPPRLLGFFVDLRSSYSGYKPFRPCFVPMLPQPPELAGVVNRVASYSFDAYNTIWVDDCQNGRILIKGCLDSRFKPGAEAGASPSSRQVHFGELLSPLCPERSMAIVPPPPHDSGSFTHGHLLSKQDGQGLCYFWFSQEGINSEAHVYMLQDGVWCMQMLAKAQLPHVIWGLNPLLVDNKIYLVAQRDIVILDLRASSFSTAQFPQGVEYGDRTIMLSRADDDSRVFLIHVKVSQLSIWLFNGDNWLLVDSICLREMCANLRMSDRTFEDHHTAVVEIIQVGNNAEFVFLTMGRSVLYLDVKCRTLRKVYEMSQNDQCMGRTCLFMMIWPPTFPAPKDDPARDAA